jgi:hypothetical protein
MRSMKMIFFKTFRLFFERLRRYRIKLNPKKSVIGLHRVEWVGHQIDADGMHFTPDKLNEVADFATPQGAKALCSFLGFTQYFLNTCSALRYIGATFARCVAKA